MTEPVLSVRNLRVAFAGRRGTLTAIDDVSFDIARGEILGVVGESGAGKSVTGSAVIGLIDPPGGIVGGQVLLNGERIDNLPPEALRRIRGRRIGMIFQDPLTSLDPLYRVGEQIVETIAPNLQRYLTGDLDAVLDQQHGDRPPGQRVAGRGDEAGEGLHPARPRRGDLGCECLRRGDGRARLAGARPLASPSHNRAPVSAQSGPIRRTGDH